MRYQIQIAKERMHFSAAHFTIFSDTERENLHGHHYQLALDLALESPDVQALGLECDYNILKNIATNLCQSLDEFLLLPSQNPYLRLKQTDTHWICQFGADPEMQFLHRDVKILPLSNITGEALSHWFLAEIHAVLPEVFKKSLQQLTVSISSGPDQWVGAVWNRVSIIEKS